MACDLDDWIRLLMGLVPALPLAAALAVGALGPRVLRGASHWPVLVALAASCLASLLLLGHVRQQPVGFERVETYGTWAVVDAARGAPRESAAGARDPARPNRDLVVQIALRLDTLTSVMLTMVTSVSLLVAVYAVGYMRGDRGYWRFFAYIALFVFSMTMLVSASNFVLLYVFWEAVGVCSYLLIGFWYEKPAAAAAGTKAFLVNRIGDFGFLLGIFLIWTTYGSLNYHDVPRPAAEAAPAAATARGAELSPAVQPGVLGAARIRAQAYVGGGTGLAIGLLLLLGACGKSAQFPLHVWLPDAMEGPTPVSALIHAATMVTAGVYMVARCTPLYSASPEAQMVVAAVGTFTALLAGLIALTQFDLKRVLAYSTVSQLGFMFLGLGTGTLAGITGGMFHLITHAFFKALLFLSAGSVMHAMGNVVDMRQFSGLRRLLPYTFATFLIGALALAGVVPMSGFWSKDAILAAVHGQAQALEEELGARRTAATRVNEAPVRAVAAHAPAAAAGGDRATWRTWSEAQLARGARLYELLYYTAMGVAFLTSVYTFRMLYLTFFGPLQVPREAGDHARESPRVMVVPLLLLAVGAALIGLWLDHSVWNGTHPFGRLLQATPALTGAVAETETLGAFHVGPAATSTAVALAGIALASWLYLAPGRGARRDAAGGSIWYRLSYGRFYLDELYNALVVRPLAGLAGLWARADDVLVDGLVQAIARVPLALGAALRSLQTGLVQFYALAMAAGVLLLLLSDPELAARMWAWLGDVWSRGGRP